MSKENFRIIVVDDESSFLLLLTKILEDEGYTVKAVSDPEVVLKIIDSFSPNLLITDLKMPKIDGISLMEAVKNRNADVDFVMITAFATVDTAVSAMKSGASDYIIKPLKDPEQLRIAVSKVYEKQLLLRENRFLKSETSQGMPPIEIIFAGMEDLLAEVREVAATDATVMLYGETGTGKTLIAKIIHQLSGRTGHFVDINCAAIPENLLESEMFGYEKGAFTGAVSRKIGKFELANDGTIFLDEVSEMSLALQAKFLKVLQDRTFERLGSLSTLTANARIVAATNRDLKALVDEKKFREDLFYRLNVFPVNIPSLRERKKHIPEIANYIIKIISARHGREFKPLSGDKMKMLSDYSWPGNIRELENIIERSVIISRGYELNLPELTAVHEKANEAEDSGGDIRSLEKAAIEKALIKAGTRKKAAESLGISLRALQYKIKDYGIQ
jgi:DNA-binding NtrC family response regulator